MEKLNDELDNITSTNFAEFTEAFIRIRRNLAKVYTKVTGENISDHIAEIVKESENQ